MITPLKDDYTNSNPVPKARKKILFYLSKLLRDYFLFRRNNPLQIISDNGYGPRLR